MAESLLNSRSQYLALEVLFLSENESYHRELMKRYRQTRESGNQTSIVTSTKKNENHPNETATENDGKASN